ncbi:MAG: hypothetical protein KC619_16695 [Myxococcales bacterium]|nr:hypothetical protein [Myxococcales bacterium]
MRHPLLAWIDEHHPRAAETLRPPPSEAALAEARLPPALAALYREHDGQEEGDMAASFFDEAFYWLPLALGAERSAMVREVVENVRRELPEAEPFGDAWRVFGGDLLGNLLVVDVEKDEVFPWFRDEGRIEDAPSESSEEFVARYLDQLRSGDRVIDPKLGVVDPHPPPLPPSPAPPPPNKGVLVAIVLGLVAFVLFVVWLEATR